MSFEQTLTGGEIVPHPSSAASAALPADVNNMVNSNNSLLRSMQSGIQRQIQSLTDRVDHQGKGGGKGRGAKKKGAGKRGRDEYENDADKKTGKRQVTDGRTVFNRRSKRGKR